MTELKRLTRPDLKVTLGDNTVVAEKTATIFLQSRRWYKVWSIGSPV